MTEKLNLFITNNISNTKFDDDHYMQLLNDREP